MTTFKISGVTFTTKYNGSYASIFRLLDRDRIFTEVYETEDSKGLVGNDYFLTISETPEPNILEQILKLKNVELL